MTSKIHDMYVELKKCTEALEADVQNSLGSLTEANGIALESSKDYHYKEILSQLNQIKDHIRIIAEHTTRIEALQTGNKIDRNYIQKQVETFQNFGKVTRREHKPVRPRETASMKFLQCWEKIMEENKSETNGFVIPKRTNSLRKKKKIVSSTVDGFLDTSGRSISFDSLLDETEEVTFSHLSKSVDDLDLTAKPDTKPRIVDFIYKNPPAEAM